MITISENLHLKGHFLPPPLSSQYQRDFLGFETCPCSNIEKYMTVWIYLFNSFFISAATNLYVMICREAVQYNYTDTGSIPNFKMNKREHMEEVINSVSKLNNILYDFTEQ